MQIAEYPKDTRYKVCSDGYIIGPKVKKLKVGINQGYEYVGIGNKTMKVHRMVCETFLPNPNNYPQVNHKNGIKNDNRLENLEWCNPKHNIKHAFESGLMSHKGERNSRNILPLDHIPIIREAIEFGHSPKKICKYYGVHQNTIYQIKYNKNWSHV